MIRRNILTDETVRDQFIDGVHALKTEPWGNDGLGTYDFFIFWHHRAMMLLTPQTQFQRNAAHSGPVFLPWHRYMLTMLEFELRRVLGNDDFRLPYWDWVSDRLLADPRTSGLWDNDTLGGSGNPISSGPFQRFSSGGRE